MGINLHFGNMPPIGYIFFIIVIAILLGKLIEIPIIFWLGIISFVVFLIYIIIALIRDLFGKL